jgi:UDP:flavonoid glycosyltransferase YjiC (YdhE family)
VAEFIPFDALLPKAHVYVTTGGTQQAISAGVPVIVAGVTEDKAANAARVAYHHLGIDLQSGSPAPAPAAEAAVASETESVLTDTDTKANVHRLAQVYAAHDAVSEIEQLPLGG